MKRYSLLFSIIVVTALLLAACGTNANNAARLTPGAPGAGLATSTPDVTGGFGSTPLPADDGTYPAPGSDPALLTPTVGANQGTAGDDDNTGAYPAPTTEGAADSDGAVVQSVDRYVLLSELLKMGVHSNAGEQVGHISGAMIDRSVPATNETGQDPLLQDARVSYLLVNVTGQAGATSSSDNDVQGNEVLIPWQAFASNGAVTSQSGQGNQQALTISVANNVLSGAPRYGGAMAGAAAGADTATTQYWAERGLSIPVTGGATAVNTDSMLVRGQIGSLQINDASGQNLGQVRDFAIDRTTGEIAYAILSGGSTFNGRYVLVPMTALEWQPGPGASLGTFRTGLNAQSFQGAPTAESIETLDLNNTNPVDAYWLEQAAPALNK